MNKQELITRIEKIEYENLRYNSPERMLLEQKHLILDLVEQFDEPQKPVVPRFVADWIELCKEKADLISCLSGSYEYGVNQYKRITEDEDWLFEADHQELVARAWLYGYEVEKEPLYEVVFLEDENDRYLLMELNEHYYEIVPESENDGYRKQYFTEKEIKAIDERYWAFAVPVEEVAEG